MQSTSSVAQGTFLFLPDGFSLPKLRKSRKRKRDGVPGPKWELSFNKLWESVNKEIEDINERLFSKILQDLIEHLKKLHTNAKSSEGVIPCEILLTGTNLPDHKYLLSTLTQNVREEITPYVASLWSWHCGNLKSTVQNFVSQIIPKSKSRKKNKYREDESCVSDSGDESNDVDDSVNESEVDSGIKFHVSQYSLSTLSSWYDVECNRRNTRKPIVIIIPDFESFSPTILGDLIMLLSAYSHKISFVLVLGVATTPVAVYQGLSREVLSQLVVQLFRSEPSTSVLNKVVEDVLFSPRLPFRLGSKCMTFLTDIFLFHCFSVDGFVQGFKYCLLEHFYKRNHFALCCPSSAVDEEAKSLTEEELESIRKIPSFQKHVESSSKDVRKALLLDNDHTRAAVGKMMKDLFRHIAAFHIGLNLLHILTSDLPRAPLGRNVREYYCRCVSTNVSDAAEFKDCLKLLECQSQGELLKKLEDCLALTSSGSVAEVLSQAEPNSVLLGIATKVEEFCGLFRNMGSTGGGEDEDTGTTGEEFQELRKKLVVHLEEDMVKQILRPLTELPLHEVVHFDDLPGVRRRISGSPRGAIHLALNNPQRYLNCKCCAITEPDAILPTMPDLSIAYKIHLECNKIINMYDWLQSFAVAIKPDDAEAKDGTVDQKIQARFTRAVSELQFLGFIKPSRAKTDHVSRLTWGNS